MRRGHDASPDQIDITELGRRLRSSLPRLLLLSLGAGALTFLILSLIAPRYESEAQLAIIAKGAGSPFADSGSGGSPDAVGVRMDKEAINTHLSALRSPDLARRISGEMKLTGRPEFNGRVGSPDELTAILRAVGLDALRPGETDEDRALSAYMKRLEVYSPKESRSIFVRFTSDDADLAASIPNRIADIYRELLASRSVTESDNVLKALEPRLTELRQEAEEADKAADQFRGEANIFKGGQQATGLNEQQLGELTAELTKAQTARSEAEARTKQAREMMKSGSADALPDVQKSPLIQNLVQSRVKAERQISELSATLLPGHPRMQQLKADLAGLKQQIAAEVGKVVDSLEKEAKVAALREESIKKSLDEIKARIVTTSPDEAKLRQLEATAKSKRAELERLEAQYEANRARAQTGAVPVEVEIVTRARPASIPVFPKKVPMAFLVMTATLLFALAIVVTRGLLAGARQEPAPVSHPAPAPEEDRAEPASAGAPQRKNDPALAAWTPEPVASVAARSADMGSVGTIAEIARNLLGRHNAQGGFRTLIAGEVEGIDPGAEAMALAQGIARGSKTVVLVDWRPDGKGFAELMGITAGVGITDLLEGRAGFLDIVQRVPDSEAHVIACGSPMKDRRQGLDPDRLNLVLDALDEAYEHIVVTSTYNSARELFQAIEGRFDAGLVVGEQKRRPPTLGDQDGRFLGFEVTDIQLMRYERPAAGGVAEQRLLKGASKLQLRGAA